MVVLGLPRGGVPVAAEVARALGAPLDVVLVRKLGVPSQPELAMGAIGEGGVRVLDEDVLRVATVRPDQLDAVERRERVELDRRAQRFRSGRSPVPVEGRVVIVVDDGIATGSTARAACEVVKRRGAMAVILAAPVAPPSARHELGPLVDELVLLETPDGFGSVGQWYRDFHPTTDDEVVDLLRAAPTAATSSRAVDVAVAGVHLAGDLVVPPGARGVVVFAHGSGSSRHSPRNRAVARWLQEDGFATLLFDLLTPEEEANRGNVFDIRLLGSRLASVTRWARTQADLAALPVGYFGASTGAAAALWAAAEPDLNVSAVVSRGGRPDLAGPRLALVAAPTLLIVGGRDEVVIDLNRAAARELRCRHELTIVRGATHLFSEPGALEAVADLARHWFADHLVAPASAPMARGWPS